MNVNVYSLIKYNHLLTLEDDQKILERVICEVGKGLPAITWHCSKCPVITNTCKHHLSFMPPWSPHSYTDFPFNRVNKSSLDLETNTNTFCTILSTVSLAACSENALSHFLDSVKECFLSKITTNRLTFEEKRSSLFCKGLIRCDTTANKLMTTMSSRNIIVLQKRCHGISLYHCPLNLNICFVSWNKAAEFASWCQWRFVNIIQTVHYCNIRHCVLRREVRNLVVRRALNRNPNTGPKFPNFHESATCHKTEHGWRGMQIYTLFVTNHLSKALFTCSICICVNVKRNAENGYGPNCLYLYHHSHSVVKLCLWHKTCKVTHKRTLHS